MIPIKYQKTTLAKYGKKGRKKQLGRRKEEEGAYSYRAHPLSLLFAVTYHKLQGLSMDRIVLSINKHPNQKLTLELVVFMILIS